jgi:hypothetical protein
VALSQRLHAHMFLFLFPFRPEFPGCTRASLCNLAVYWLPKQRVHALIVRQRVIASGSHLDFRLLGSIYRTKHQELPSSMLVQDQFQYLDSVSAKAYRCYPLPDLEYG